MVFISNPFSLIFINILIDVVQNYNLQTNPKQQKYTQN